MPAIHHRRHSCSHSPAIDTEKSQSCSCRGCRAASWLLSLPSSEVQNKMIFMWHQILSCHVLVGRSFFILWKMLLSSQNLPYDHLLICSNITFQYPKKSDLVVSYNSSYYDPYQILLSPKVTSSCPIIRIIMTQNQLLLSQKNTSFSPKIHLDMI